MVLVVGSVLVGLLLGFVLASQWRGAALPWLRAQVTMAGLVLMVLGTALRWWSILTLGRYFTLDVAVRSAQPVVQSGPYRFVRHPLYTGNILLVVGFALAASRWWNLPLSLFFFWFYYPPAIEYEDRKLHRIFGAAWEQWSGRTPALMPRFAGAPAAGVLSAVLGASLLLPPHPASASMEATPAAIQSFFIV